MLFDALNSPDGTQYIGGQPGWASSHSFGLAKRGALQFLAKLDPNARVALYEAEYKRRLRTGLPFEQSILPVAGAATLRLLVEDTRSTAVGSLIIPLGRVR